MSRTHAPVWLDPIAAPSSAVYGGVVRLRNHAFDNGVLKTEHAPVPVISIGGITAGGAAKTPLSIWTLEKLLSQGVRCGLLSRGYHRKSSGTVWVSRGDGSLLSSAETGGDEPRMIAGRFPGVPVLCDKDRVHGAKLLYDEAHVQAIVLDDGFQHRRLARDIDWVVLDTALPRRALRLLPWGYLREPFFSVERSGLIWLKVPDSKQADIWTQAIRTLGIEIPTMPFRLRESGWLFKGEKLPITALKGESGVGFAGIAHPDRFQQSLRNVGVDARMFFSYRDHHHYSERDAEKLLQGMKQCGVDLLFTTEKDFIRLPETLRNIPIAVLRVEVEPLKALSEIDQQLTTILR